jgi:rhomboid protease GluP
MSGNPQLRHEGETAPVDLHDLDDRIRLGELPPSAELQHAPWTGSGFLTLGAIPELAEAFHAPGARLAAHFRAPPWPWASMLGTAVVFVFGLLQLLLGLLPGGLAETLFGFYQGSATGLEPLVFDGAWWSAWGSQLVHAGPFHLFPNLAVLGYCGYRVERALGLRGYAVTGAAAVLVGALFIALFQDSPVVGSSILGFGFWGAQLAIGFRFGDQLPPGQRRFYGYGNLLFFAFLLGGSLYQEGTSHWAHAGGFVGGGLAALLVHPPHLVAPEREARARRTQELGVLALVAASLVLGPLLRLAMPLTLRPARTVLLQDVGASVEVPARMLRGSEDRPYTFTVRGMPAWTTGPASSEFVFCGLETLRWDALGQGDPMTDEVLVSQWGRQVSGEARIVSAPAARAAGWTAHALQFHDPDGRARFLLVEHHLLRGRMLNRVGYVVELDEDGRPGPRGAVFEDLVASVQAGEPPSLAAARDEHLRNPASARLRIELARALHDVGDLEQADGLYALVIQDGGSYQGDAVTERLQLWAQEPQGFDPGPDPWFADWMLDYPGDRSLQTAGIHVLAESGRCGEARFFHESFAAARPNVAETVTTAGDVLACEQAVVRGDSSPP